jgi:hypothetical protein
MAAKDVLAVFLDEQAPARQQPYEGPDDLGQ